MNKHKIHVLYMYTYNIWRNNYLYDNVLIIADDFPMNNIHHTVTVITLFPLSVITRAGNRLRF